MKRIQGMQFSWILMLFLPASSGQVVQVWDEQVDGALAEELDEGQASVSCREWGYIWLVTSGVPWHSMWFLASPFKKNVKVHEPIPRRAPKLEKEPDGMCSEEWLRTLDLSGLERRRLRDNLTVPWENGEGGAELFFLVPSARTHGNGSKLHLSDEVWTWCDETFLYSEGGETLQDVL